MSENYSFTNMPIQCAQVTLINLVFSNDCILKILIVGCNVCGDGHENVV